MRTRVFTAALIGAVLLPALAFAQASITGVVRDTSGAVLPGVTVEAASPALIEKIRTATTDGNGRYQLIDLRPGAYTVTFSLPGFNTVLRDGITLAGAATVGVDADMRVGALEETITVTGEAPVVDTTSTSRSAVLSADTIDALPTARNYVTLARLIPAANGGGTDVGGSNLQGVGGSVTVHGSREQDQRVTLNGINTMTLQAGGNIGGQIPDVGSAAEVTVDHTGVSAELPTGGVRINFIPRDGGNTWANSTFFTFSHDNLQGTNFSDELRNAGLRTPNEVKKNWDLNSSFGGPFRRDKVWYWASIRYNGVENYAPVFQNLNAYNPNEWLYEPDTANRGILKGRSYNSSLRVTWQATPKHKIAGTYKADTWCDCPNGISATVAPEAARDFRFPRLRQEHVEWTSPMTNRLLFEAVGMHLYERWGFMHPQAPRGSSPEFEDVAAQMISVTEQSNGLAYRAPALLNNNTRVPNWTYRAAMSYVTGTHNVKFGFNRVHGFQETTSYSLADVAYRFNNGIPNLVTMRALPVTFENHLNNDLGFFVQDRVSVNRATMNVALRFDHFKASFPEQAVGPSNLSPGRNFVFPAQENLNWNDLTYRTGLTYDVTGTGRTAAKITFNKYLRGQTLNLLGTDPNPVNTMINTTTRAWNDANGNFSPDCDLLNFNANGECNAVANRNFGSAIPGATFDDILRRGYGNRETNWEFSAGVQHEILPRVSVDVGYFRRIWKNFRVTDNLALSADDFDVFSMTVPSDPRLPGGGGYTIDGLYALKPTAFGRPTQNHNTLDRAYGSQYEHWNGVDVTVDARLQNGLTMQLGTSTGKTSEDNCDVVAQVPEINEVNPGGGNPTGWRPAQWCSREEPFLTNFKAYAVYTVPGIDVQLSGTFRSVPGAVVRAVFNASNAYLAANSTLGRPLAGGVPNMAIDIIEPNAQYLDRRNELDLRFGKVLRFGRSRSVVSVDLFNALNTDVPITANQNFGAWLAPTSILQARMVKLSLQFDF
ncbi:MAG: carboxypeptidase regulatory-like domain-containing protein [Vicinamibacterales bacterium]